ncbi:hypothetical protein ON058_05685 [Demequina sp. B12]|uniref:hypothetical protein n=1 Tax=Demequina sp. B12 TaxID=2992757 RepID=UPI00237B2359|nr:hypothetical protein [Demequina sp. B12]MDE0572903.1 hypothetical protein [Demequina sp. B12]
MKFRPMPITGALLGLVIGLLTAALLSVLGVVPLDRLPLLSLIAVGLVVGTLALTQRVSAARGRVTTVSVIAVLFAGAALTGIPEYVSHGSLTPGCTLQASSSLEPDPVTPEGTSATDPFDMTLTDTVEWVAATSDDADGGSPELALMVAGVPVPVWNGVDVSTDGEQAWTGTDSVERWQSNIRESAGFTLTGIYHFQGTLTYATGECVADAYLRISPPHAFAGPLLMTLWAVLIVAVAGLVALAVVVARRARREEKEPITDTLTTTGGAVSGSPEPEVEDSLADAPEEDSASSEDESDPADEQLDPASEDSPKANTAEVGEEPQPESDADEANEPTVAGDEAEPESRS